MKSLDLDFIDDFGEETSRKRNSSSDRNERVHDAVPAGMGGRVSRRKRKKKRNSSGRR